MKPNIVKDEILDILESLQEQIPVLIDYTDKIPQIELDIVMSNVRKLYENINELKSLDQFVVEEEVAVAGAVAGKKEEAAGAVAEGKKEEAVSSQQSAVGSQEELIVAGAEEKKEEEVAVAGEKEESKVEAPVREPVKIVFESREEEIIGPKKRQIEEKSTIDLFSSPEESVVDKFKDNSKSINEDIYGDKEDESVAAKMQKEKIKDLKLAIGLNEKFLFINELFDGNMKAYSEAIDQLNKQEALEEVVKTFEEIKLKNKWDETTDTYKKLLNLIERKF